MDVEHPDDGVPAVRERVRDTGRDEHERAGAGDDFFVDSGTATISFPGTITNTAAHSVNVANRTTGGSGAITFTGAISDTGSGILLDNNDGGTISFRGGLSLSTGGNTAFSAINGGTIEV